jgi:hypothetical protein
MLCSARWDTPMTPDRLYEEAMDYEANATHDYLSELRAEHAEDCVEEYEDQAPFLGPIRDWEFRICACAGTQDIF